MRTAWLLHLLDDHPAHGYGAERQLDEIGLSAKLPATYRTLRGFEREGWASSALMEPSCGPQRRVYRLTRAGRRELDAITARITQVRDLHDAFLRAYELARG